MRGIAIIYHSVRTSFPGTRAAGRGIAAAVLAAVLATSTSARAGIDGTTSVAGDALAQIAMDALSQGVAGPGSWEQRAMLVGLGVAGLHFGASTRPIARVQPKRAVAGASARLVLPMAGAALGSLVACHGVCGPQNPDPGPSLGAVAGTLVAHVLYPDTSPERRNRTSGDAARAVAWTPLVAIGPGSYIAGVLGRF